MLHVAYWLRGLVNTCGFANGAPNAMPVHSSGPMAISNDRDSHALGMRTCDQSCSDKRFWTAKRNLRDIREDRALR
jgi:hypothetical protein